jgi:hypothetical protein
MGCIHSGHKLALPRNRTPHVHIDLSDDARLGEEFHGDGNVYRRGN